MLFKLFIYFCLVCRSMLPACMYVHCVFAWNHRGRESASDPSTAGVAGRPELPCECWELNHSPLQEDQGLLTTKPSSSPIIMP